MSIGLSLASGNGFKDPVGPWPNLSDYARMPAWPTVISLGIRIVPGVAPEAVSRYSNAVCLSVAAAFFCALSMLVGAARKLSAAAGLSLSLSPLLVYLSVGGMSEILFVMILAIGVTALLAGRRWLYPAALILGTAALVRSNFILVLPVFCLLAILIRSSRHALLHRVKIGRAILACMLAAAPTLAWTVRNAQVTGRFPLISSMEGETFYGANNSVVAINLEYWGYWVMPNDIPGETPKLELAHQLGRDLALNDYYHRKGMAWIRQNVSALPRLELGKFVRAFVPIPWIPRPASYGAFFFRFLLDVLWVALFPFWWPKMNKTYLLFCLAMAIAHVVTTAIYYGAARFTHCYVEIFFIPCIVLGLQQWRATRLSMRTNDGEAKARPRLVKFTQEAIPKIDAPLPKQAASNYQLNQTRNSLSFVRLRSPSPHLL